MATKIISMTYQLKRGTESAIEAKNPILASGEPIIVFCPNNVTKIKVGNGSTPYKELPFVGGTISYDGDGDIVNITVDSELSLTSTNPVQNKVITKAINDKASKADLKNFVDKSDLATKADKVELDNKVDKEEGKGLSTNDFSDAEKVKLAALDIIKVDTAIDSNSFNPVTNNAVANAFSDMNSKIYNLVLDGGEII